MRKIIIFSLVFFALLVSTGNIYSQNQREIREATLDIQRYGIGVHDPLYSVTYIHEFFYQDTSVATDSSGWDITRVANGNFEGAWECMKDSSGGILKLRTPSADNEGFNLFNRNLAFRMDADRETRLLIRFKTDENVQSDFFVGWGTKSVLGTAMATPCDSMLDVSFTDAIGFYKADADTRIFCVNRKNWVATSPHTGDAIGTLYDTTDSGEILAATDTSVFYYYEIRCLSDSTINYYINSKFVVSHKRGTANPQDVTLIPVICYLNGQAVPHDVFVDVAVIEQKREMFRRSPHKFP